MTRWVFVLNKKELPREQGSRGIMRRASYGCDFSNRSRFAWLTSADATLETHAEHDFEPRHIAFNDAEWKIEIPNRRGQKRISTIHVVGSNRRLDPGIRSYGGRRRGRDGALWFFLDA